MRHSMRALGYHYQPSQSVIIYKKTLRRVCPTEKGRYGCKPGSWTKDSVGEIGTFPIPKTNYMTVIAI